MYGQCIWCSRFNTLKYLHVSHKFHVIISFTVHILYQMPSHNNNKSSIPTTLAYLSSYFIPGIQTNINIFKMWNISKDLSFKEHDNNSHWNKDTAVVTSKMEFPDLRLSHKLSSMVLHSQESLGTNQVTTRYIMHQVNSRNLPNESRSSRFTLIDIWSINYKSHPINTE